MDFFQGYGMKTVYHSYDTDGTYFVKFEGWYNGQYDYDTDYITVNIPELEVWTDGPWTGEIGETIYFHVYASRGTPPYTGWEWYFEDNDDPGENFYKTGQNVYHTFYDEATYTVTLTVTDSDSETDYSTSTCTIEAPDWYNIDIEVNVWP